MTEDIEALLAAAEQATRLWRLGEAREEIKGNKMTVREAMNILDWTCKDVKKRLGKESTRVIHRDDVRLDHAGE